jgi:hypothetical protein
MRTQAGVVLFAVILIGCGNLASQKRGDVVLQDTGELKGKLMTVPAQLRNVYIKNPTADNSPPSYISCAEPAPDAALSDTFKLIAGLTQDVSTDASTADVAAKAGKKLAINSDFQTSTTAMELAGRTQLVLLARELLYRACEYRSNNWLKEAEVKDAYNSVIKALVTMTDTEKTNAEAKAKNADTAATALKLDLKVLGATSERFYDLSRSLCIVEYDDCIKKAAADANKEKVCKGTLSNCVK